LNKEDVKIHNVFISNTTTKETSFIYNNSYIRFIIRILERINC